MIIMITNSIVNVNDLNYVCMKRYPSQITSLQPAVTFQLRRVGWARMGELQATIELAVHLHKFYNVDLFQRGWVQ